MARIPPGRLSCAAPMPLPPTSAANPPTHRFWISPSIKSLTPCNAASEPSLDCRRLFRALACSTRLSRRRHCAFPRASHVPFHSPRCRRWLRRPHRSRLRRRLSSQAGSPHRHGPLRPHAQSSVPRQLSPHPRRSHRHAFLDRIRLAPALLRPGLHLRHAPGRKRTPRKTRPRLRLLRRISPALFSKPHSPASARLPRRPFLLVPIQKKSRTPSRLRLSPPPSPPNNHLAHPHRLVCFCGGRPSGRFLGCFSLLGSSVAFLFEGQSFRSDINIHPRLGLQPLRTPLFAFGCPHAAVACGVLRFSLGVAGTAF